METIAEIMDAQCEIIKLQAEIIERLSFMLLQFAEISEEEQRMISRAAEMRKAINQEQI